MYKSLRMKYTLFVGCKQERLSVPTPGYLPRDYSFTCNSITASLVHENGSTE